MKQISVIHLDAVDSFGRGVQHGKALSQMIRTNISLYRSLFKQNESVLAAQIAEFSENIRAFSQDYFDEMRGVAEGAGVSLEEIVMLNSRTELFNLSDAAPISECFVFFFSKSGLLCQNWDWWEKSATGVALLNIRYQSGHTILVFTEAGILGKFGMSSKGFGTTFSYLYPDTSASTRGLPVHILLRAALDAESFDDAARLLGSEQVGTSGNILLASSDGRAQNFELSGSRTSVIPLSDTILMHTNHYVGGTANDASAGEGFLHNSIERYSRGEILSKEINSWNKQDAMALLADRTEGEGMLCRSFKAEGPGEEPTGTIASVIMDLRNETIDVALLPQDGASYTESKLR